MVDPFSKQSSSGNLHFFIVFNPSPLSREEVSVFWSHEQAALRQTEPACETSCWGEHIKGTSAAQTGLPLI